MAEREARPPAWGVRPEVGGVSARDLSARGRPRGGFLGLPLHSHEQQANDDGLRCEKRALNRVTGVVTCCEEKFEPF